MLEISGIRITGLDARKTFNRIVKNDRVGIFMAETCARKMNPYVPMISGALSQTYDCVPWEVHYTMPYAHREFVATHEHSKEMHPLATSRWDKATKNAEGVQIAKEVTAYIKRGL